MSGEKSGSYPWPPGAMNRPRDELFRVGAKTRTRVIFLPMVDGLFSKLSETILAKQPYTPQWQTEGRGSVLQMASIGTTNPAGPPMEKRSISYPGAAASTTFGEF